MKLPASFTSLLCVLSATAVCHAVQPYSLIKEIPIGGEGGWDYLSIDEGASRLYVSHATKVVVVDLENDAVVGEIADTPGVHGLAVAPGMGRGFTSNGKEGKVSVVDLKTLKTLSKSPAGSNPDAILFDPGQKEVYAFNGHSKSATVLSAATGELVATIPLSGKPEFAAADPAAGKVFCNIEDKSEVAVIDTKTHKVVATWPIAPGESASGMAIDLENHRLFLGCDNKLMLMLDSTTGKVLGSVPIGDHVDANAFDPESHLAFASCGDGTTTIASDEDPSKLTVVQTLTTEKSARTMALDSKTHKIYLASAKFEPVTKSSSAEGHQRPKIIPGSLKILVYGR